MRCIKDVEHESHNVFGQNVGFLVYLEVLNVSMSIGKGRENSRSPLGFITILFYALIIVRVRICLAWEYLEVESRAHAINTACLSIIVRMLLNQASSLPCCVALIVNPSMVKKMFVLLTWYYKLVCIYTALLQVSCSSPSTHLKPT